MTVDEFIKAYPNHGVKAGTINVWRSRGKVPAGAIDAMVAVGIRESLTTIGPLPPSVLIPAQTITISPGKSLVGCSCDLCRSGR